MVTYTTEQRTKEVSYTYNVPEYTTEAYEVTRNDRVCEEQVEEYTVCVPHVVAKEQQVQVCKMVPRWSKKSSTHAVTAELRLVDVVCSCRATAAVDGAPAAAPCGCGK